MVVERHVWCAVVARYKLAAFAFLRGCTSLVVGVWHGADV